MPKILLLSGKISKLTITILCVLSSLNAMLFIPMDKEQTDHLKAYGVIYRAIQKGIKSHWLLNYRGGSFALEYSQSVENDAKFSGVLIKNITDEEYTKILSIIANSNMEVVALEKSAKIAVYTPKSKLPWDDAVTMVLTYAGIPYDKVYDKEILTGQLKNYDWLHLHHEDFTGQYSKFYTVYHNELWYKRQKMALEAIARELNFDKVTECKKAVAFAIQKYVERGGFLFAMCSAPNTLDIALASLGTDIVEDVFDGDGVDPDYAEKLNYDNCFAFENFKIQTSAMVSYFGNIDVNRVNTPQRIPTGDFKLFPFSAKLDPIPTMLNQNHVDIVKGFYGLATSFRRSLIKKSIIILGDIPNTQQVKYLYGIRGKGMFTFLGGHDPEDFSHAVGDAPTMLDLHKNSPGYRLILNNVLFPSAEKKEKKT